MRTALLREVVPAERPAKGPACRSTRRDTPPGGDPAKGRRLRAGPGTQAPAERTAEGSRLPECAAKPAHGGDPARGRRRRAGPGTHAPAERPAKGPACRSARRDTPHGGDPGKRPAPKGRTRDALREGEVKPHMRRTMTTNNGDPRPEQARNLRQKIIIA